MTDRLIAAVALPVLALAALLKRRTRLLVWGPVPVINNKYWSHAMREAGHPSVTLMREYFAAINERSDFDLYFDDVTPRWLPRRFGPYAAAYYVLRRARVLHLPFSGGPLGGTPLWRVEAQLLRLARVRSVLIPYGADLFVEDRLLSESLRTALGRMREPDPAVEAQRAAVVDYWQRHADVIVVGFAFDGLTRIDAPVGNMIGLDLAEWPLPPPRPGHDGRNGPVTIFHAPNHQGAKGTAEIEAALETLRDEGLSVELIPRSRVPNRAISGLLADADIHADQILVPGYGLAAIEGMASGLPVICNLSDRVYTSFLREHSFLAECPVVSATPDSIVDVLRRLVTDPEIRLRLGAAGRAYVERYHSFDAVRYVFESIYASLDGAEVDLGHLFAESHRPPIDHPLVDHELP